MLKFLFIIFALFISSSTVARAMIGPDFPSCNLPESQLIAKYDSGMHGIPGYTEAREGSDYVYRISNTQVVQCFCPSSGNQGIKTDWLKILELGTDQINDYEKNGWNYIPDGSLWGLDQGMYMAKNSYFQCRGGVGGGGGQANAPVCDSKTPEKPKNVLFIQSKDKATITWTKVENATHYSILYGPSQFELNHSVPNTGNVNTFTIEKLDPNTNYVFAVRAVNNCQPGDLSFEDYAIGGGEVLSATGGSWKGIFGTLISLLSLALYISYGQKSA